MTAGSLAAGLTLSGSGSLSGTPTTAGPANFTVTATDNNGATGSAAYSISVTAPSAMTLAPAGGALPEAMAGEGYATSIGASGGVGTVIYAMTTGALPAGLVLNASTGELRGSVTAATGDHSFSIEAHDQSGGSVVGNYTLRVIARDVTAENQAVTVPLGSTPVPVDLTAGATGGPFDSAHIVSVTPPHAGTATIAGADVAGINSSYSGIYLKFVPNAQFAGTAEIAFTLTSVLGLSNTAVVSFTTSINPVAVEDFFADARSGFVTARAGILADTVDAPGLLERRGFGFLAGQHQRERRRPVGDAELRGQFAGGFSRGQCRRRAGTAAGR